MLHAFLIQPEDISIAVEGTNAVLSTAYPFTASANPVDIRKMPLGVVATNGNFYGAGHPHLPALFIYDDGGAEIREEYDIEAVAKAKHVFAGAEIIIKDNKLVVKDSSTFKTEYKTAIGLRKDGSLIYVLNRCTTREIALALHALGAVDALLLSTKDVYLEYEGGHIRVGTRPVTVIQAQKVKDLPRPIVVIDVGHGGVNPGAMHFGMKEKDLTLRHSLITHKHLVNNYVGTFLLTRDDDSTMSLAERVAYANAIDADLFLSIHSNAGGGTGFESFASTVAHPQTRQWQQTIHTEVANYLASKGFRDRGMKLKDFYVLTRTRMSAILLELLFMDSPGDAQALQNPEIIRGMCLAVAEGVVKALKLQKLPPKDEAPKEPEQLYVVQVGAFRTMANAERLRVQLKELGFDGFVVKKGQ